MRAAERCLRSAVPEELSEGCGETSRRLGTDGHLLCLPQGTLGSSSNDKRGGIALWCHPLTDGCSETVQEGRERNRNDLEAAQGRGERIPHVERLPVTSRSV